MKTGAIYLTYLTDRLFCKTESETDSTQTKEGYNKEEVENYESEELLQLQA